MRRGVRQYCPFTFSDYGRDKHDGCLKPIIEASHYSVETAKIGTCVQTRASCVSFVVADAKARVTRLKLTHDRGGSSKWIHNTFLESQVVCRVVGFIESLVKKEVHRKSILQRVGGAGLPFFLRD